MILWSQFNHQNSSMKTHKDLNAILRHFANHLAGVDDLVSKEDVEEYLETNELKQLIDGTN